MSRLLEPDSPIVGGLRPTICERIVLEQRLSAPGLIIGINVLAVLFAPDPRLLIGSYHGLQARDHASQSRQPAFPCQPAFYTKC